MAEGQTTSETCWDHSLALRFVTKSCGHNTFQHATKHELMYGIKRVPVNLPEKPHRVKDGRNLYKVNAEQGSVTIIDAATNIEIGKIKEIGKNLSLIILSV